MSTLLSNRSHGTAARRLVGFTLIEVLLGVLILGLGLLGLASVFPLVVKKQRDAQDVVLGLSSIKGVESTLRGHAGLNSNQTDRGWAKLATALKSVASKNSDRKVRWSEVLGSGTGVGEKIYASVPQIGELRPEPGTIVFWGQNPGAVSADTVAQPSDTVLIRTSDRLIPQGPGVTPQYVWDIVPILANALPTPAPEFPAIRVALFVRRIDTGIRVPNGKSLTQVIANGEAAAIAWDSSGFPTYDGKLTGGSYAGFFAPAATGAYQRFGTKDAPYTVLQFGGLADDSAALTAIRQLGQQIVDGEGNIYTVVAIPDEKDGGYNSTKSVIVAPPLVESAVRSISGGGGTNGGIVEFLVSPVIPASVEIVHIRP